MSIWKSAEFDDHEQVCFFSDAKSGLRAIVAIHSTALGPAAGGARFRDYADDSLAIDDALRLSRAMSYKSALAGLPIGGGKSVILGDPNTLKSRELLHTFGRYIDRIGDWYATGEDVGITLADVEVIGEVTSYVGGTSKGAGDPSVHTAAGVLHGLRAVAERRFDRPGPEGLTVAVQGLGAVGWGVASRLHAEGARLVVADVRPEVVEKAVRLFGARAVDTDIIHKVDADIYAPCALGGVISVASAAEIGASVVAGAANNQLATPEAGAALAERGILYAPDYVLNAGGVISGVEAITGMPGRPPVASIPLEERLAGIYDRLGQIFDRAAADKQRPEVVAEQMACELIGRDSHRTT